MNLNVAYQAWQKFWFAPTSPLPMAVFRIFVGALLLQNILINIGSDYMTWYGPKSIISFQTIKNYWWFNTPHFDIFQILPPTEAGAMTFWWLYVLALICLTCGFCTRYAAIIVCLCNVSMHNHEPFNINGGDSMLRLYSMYLPFSECGAALSIDSLIKRFLHPELKHEKVLVLCLGTRLIQLQICIVYWSTFCYKIVGPQWLDGTAVYYATRLQDMAKFSLPGGLFDNLFLLKLLTWFTLIVEFGMFTAVWISQFRYWVLLGALILHLGIDYAINLPLFEWAFMVGFITFVRGEDLEAFLALVKVRISKFFLSKSNETMPSSVQPGGV